MPLIVVEHIIMKKEEPRLRTAGRVRKGKIVALVERMNQKTVRYLTTALRALQGLLHVP